MAFLSFNKSLPIAVPAQLRQVTKIKRSTISIFQYLSQAVSGDNYCVIKNGKGGG